MQTSQLEPLNGRSRLRFIGLTLLIALPVTAVFTYPLIFQLQTGIAGYFGADALNHAWSTWWYKNALVNLGQSPAEISYIYYPNLIYHPNVVAAPWAKLVAYPFLQFLDPIPLYNLHLFLAFVLIWVLMALLCLELTQNPVAALIGGAIFTFAANRTMHAIAGHFTQSLIYTYPMLVLALWIAWKRPSIGKGFFLAFALILSAIVDLMPLAFFAIPVTAVLLIHFLQTDKRSFFSRKRMITFGIGFGMAGIVLLWVMWPLLSNVANGGLDWYQADGVGEFSADL
ncbi:MAG: hypothetical protein GY943_38840, partial [Chloroflexi bacterium]|nr:hypothetical protein [Chloroflexota bacterium]